MKNWDDLRFFIQLARTGSVSGAAVALGVNHSTVSRRIASMEEDAGVRLFDRTPDGYALTPGGAALLERCDALELAVSDADRVLAAHHQGLAGELIVTMPQALGLYVITPMLPRFRAMHPDITLTLVSNDSTASLSRREADIAIRASSGPDETLVGRRLCAIRTAVYADKTYWESLDGAAPAIVGLIGSKTPPAWVRRDYPEADIGLRVAGKVEVLGAVTAGLGIARLPCRVGDTRPGLIRVPPVRLESDQDLWLLMHTDLQNTPRVRAFCDFIYEAFRQEKALFEGEAKRAA